MVCKDCRNVETVDVGVGDYLIESTAEIGVGDGIIDPDWLLKDGEEEQTCEPDAANKETKIKSKAGKAETKNKSQAGKTETKTKSKRKAEKVVKDKPGKTIAALKKNNNNNLKAKEKPRVTLKIKIKPVEREKSPPVKDNVRSKLRSDNVKSGSSQVKLGAKRSSPFSESDESSESKSEDDDDDEFDIRVLNENKPKRIYKKVECEVCKRLFRTNYMKEHMQTHEEDDEKRRPFKCEKCDKRFANLKNFNNHSKICGLEKSEFQCHVCQKNLCNKHSLDLHIETHSTDRPYTFQCHLCAKMFKNSSNLNYHIKSHSEDKPFACDICQNRFKDKRGLKLHVTRFHQKIFNKFECDMCDKVFRQKCRLNAHRDEHLGIKRFKCEVCEKQFGSYNVWKTHLLIHKDKKRFSCSECGKGFNHGTDLKRHMSTHTGIKPFRCDVCAKQFIHKVYLVRHKCAQNNGAEAAGNSETRKKKSSGNFETHADRINEQSNRYYANSDYVMGERSAINNQISSLSNNDNRFENDLFHHL